MDDELRHAARNRLKAEYKRVDVKHRQQQLGTSMPGRHVTLYKMHGDVSAPDEAVLVKEDYETYDGSRQLFSFKLQGDLVSKTFLFVGFSFSDPNVEYLLSRIRGLMGKNVRDHYCFMKVVDRPAARDGKADADYQYNNRRQELLIGDLKRYGIRTVLLESYDEILSHAGAIVFISGNKPVEGSIAIADGCLEEFTIARRLGRTPIPIGCTGHAAAQIWRRVHDEVEKFYPGDPAAAREALVILNDIKAGNATLINGVMALIDLAGEAS